MKTVTSLSLSSLSQPNGEAKEVYSTLHDGEGSVKTATLLKSPPPSKDNFRSSRPLLAIVKKGRYG